MPAEKKDEKLCPNCRKCFVPSTRKQLWCSHKCKDAYQHRARRRLKKCRSDEERERLRISFYKNHIEIKRFERRRYEKVFNDEIVFNNRSRSKNIIEIPIRGKALGTVAIIDDTPHNREIAKMKFSLDHYGYPISNNGSPQHLHHLVFGWPPEGYVVDHINGDILDCRQCNLRFATKGENNFNKKERVDNSSGKTGVYYNKSSKKWYSRIGKNGQNYNLGTYDSFLDAVAAREKAEIELYGYRLNGVRDNDHTQVISRSENRGKREKSRLKRSARNKRNWGK